MHLKRIGLPHLGTDGVGFAMMRDDGVRQQCLVERDALALLAGRHLMSGEMSEAFERYRDAIEAAAIHKFATGSLDGNLVVIERRDVLDPRTR
jgi:Protein of unknown function (DUF1488)